MAGSQLKRLKASLREQGITGAQQSKKQKRQQAEDLKARNEKRLQRSSVLENIREQFNPFQFKTNARGPKFDVTTNRPDDARTKMGIKGRPGLSKAVGEQKRRETLLVEMERRNKVGGILDRRFGEDDPNMTPEEKMMERFALEKLRLHKKRSMFDLEDDEPSEGLTHAGKPMSFDGPDIKDDFEEDDLLDNASDVSDDDLRKRLKRMRGDDVDDDEEEEAKEDEPERKKSKKEVMEEVIAKSKQFKYERQAAKEEDEDLRMELDKDLADVRSLLFNSVKPRADGAEQKKDQPMILDRAAMEKDYDLRLKQMLRDTRAAPATRTKTEEEIAEEEAKRLKELEENRLKRMRGEHVSDDEDEENEKKARKGKKKAPEPEEEDEEEEDQFGLGAGIKMRPTATELGFDDEDDFIIDDNLVASGSELDMEDMEESNIDSDEEPEEEREMDDFSKLLAELEKNNPVPKDKTTGKPLQMDEHGIPYTFDCPQSFEELERLFDSVPAAKWPMVVQRIRALYHPQLAAENKEKMGNFSKALVRFIGYITQSGEVDFPVVETLIRHLHSLAKTYTIEIAREFREMIHYIAEDDKRAFELDFGHLVTLTAVGTIFPTSDHFHQVVTPAMLLITRYLGQKIWRHITEFATGAYLAILAIQFQHLSKRYVPELVNFCLNTLCALAPKKMADSPGLFPIQDPPDSFRIRKCAAKTVRKLSYTDTHGRTDNADLDRDQVKVALVSTVCGILKSAAETWSGKPAFYETFSPALPLLQHYLSPACKSHLPPALLTTISNTTTYLNTSLRIAHHSRRPLELHHHKPLALKTFVPKFEDSFDPDKHYDPDRERAELAKLKAEHKRERKGAMRELRKDAGFLARENLRKKIVVDEAYDKKYRRLVAEIQSEEGKESNAYDREKDARKRAKKRG